MIEDRKTNELMVLMPPLDLSRKRIKIQKVQYLSTRYPKPAVESRSTEKAEPRSPYLNSSFTKPPNPQTPYKRLNQIHKTLHLTPKPTSTLLPIENKPQPPSTDISNRESVEDRLHLSKLDSIELLGEITMKSVRLGDVLSEGEEAVVRKGFWIDRGKLVAVKIKKLSTINCEAFRQMSHKNVVSLYGVEKLHDQVHLFMEYMPGGSLTEIMREFGPFEQKVIRKYAKTLLQVLVYLHRLNIVHRDIRCSNILSDCKGNIKLGGFGNARLLDNVDPQLSQSFIGSFYWVPPQLLNAKNRPNKKVDIWALGCTIIEMATGKHPWSHCSSFSEFAKLVEESRMPALPAHLSPDCQDFLRECFTFEVRERKSAQELKQCRFVWFF